MKKFTTTFFLLLAMVLLLPIDAGAQGHEFYLLCDGNKWEKNDNYKFTPDGNSGIYKFTLQSSELPTDVATNGCFYMRVRPYYNGNRWDNNVDICPNLDGDKLTDTYYEANLYAGIDKAWEVTYNAAATKYVFTLDRKDASKNKLKVETVTESVPTTTATLTYGSNTVEGKVSGNVYTFSNIPYSAFNNTTSVSFQLMTVTDGETKYYNMPSGTESINAGEAYTAETSSTGTDWKYTKTTVPNKGTFSVTLNNGVVTLTDNTSTSTTPPTPVTGKNLYLVGNFMFTDGTNINYDCEYFKMKDNGDNTYSIDIPATLTVNFQLLSADGENKVLYGPTTGKCDINTSNPQKTLSVNGDLAETTKTLTNYWAMADRTSGVQNKEEAGMYTVTVTVDGNGVPTNWQITHDNLTRVAYFLSDLPHASLQPSYNYRDQATAAFNNVHFGNVYLPAGAKCYVVSNIGGYVYSGGSNDMLETKTKLYLQGNSTGNKPDGGDNNTKVYPIAGGSKPFIISETEATSGLLEYAPARGHGNYVYDRVTGEVLVKSEKGDKEGIVLPSIKNIKITGPGVGSDEWQLTDDELMTYNPAENCWEKTIITTAPAGNVFRFVANDDWNINWGEDDIAARIPYDDASADGSPAIVKDPNDVELDLGGTSYTSHDNISATIPDIIFNRNGGKWTIRFYIETEQIPGTQDFNYNFKYTINGYRSVLRTYCMPEDRKPTDENIKIYGAYAFDNESGKVKLYEMNYIPANEGVILIGTGVDYLEAAKYTPVNNETKYKNIPDTEYHNDLVGVLVDTQVNASVFEGNTRVGRNFFFNYLSNTDYYTEGDVDYLGFFRVKSGSICRANYAYLYLPTTVLTWNGQTLDDVLEDNTSTLSKGIQLSFGIADEDFDSVTGITNVEKEVKTDNSYYTLQGIRVSTPSKGIYIHNGKKIIIK